MFQGVYFVSGCPSSVHTCAKPHYRITEQHKQNIVIDQMRRQIWEFNIQVSKRERERENCDEKESKNIFRTEICKYVAHYFLSFIFRIY
jgi:hypothetical protein